MDNNNGTPTPPDRKVIDPVTAKILQQSGWGKEEFDQVEIASGDLQTSYELFQKNADLLSSRPLSAGEYAKLYKQTQKDQMHYIHDNWRKYGEWKDEYAEAAPVFRAVTPESAGDQPSQEYMIKPVDASLTKGVAPGIDQSVLKGMFNRLNPKQQAEGRGLFIDEQGNYHNLDEVDGAPEFIQGDKKFGMVLSTDRNGYIYRAAPLENLQKGSIIRSVWGPPEATSNTLEVFASSVWNGLQNIEGVGGTVTEWIGAGVDYMTGYDGLKKWGAEVYNKANINKFEMADDYNESELLSFKGIAGLAGSLVPDLIATWATGGAFGAVGGALRGAGGAIAGHAIGAAVYNSASFAHSMNEAAVEAGINDEARRGLVVLGFATGWMVEKITNQLGVKGVIDHMAGGKVAKEQLQEQMNRLARESISEYSDNLFNASAEVRKKGIAQTIKSYGQKLFGEGGLLGLQAIEKEAKGGGKEKFLRVGRVRAGLATAAEEGMDEMMEGIFTDGIQATYDALFADPNAKVGEGRFGTNFSDILGNMTENLLAGMLGGSLMGTVMGGQVLPKLDNHLVANLSLQYNTYEEAEKVLEDLHQRAILDNPYVTKDGRLVNEDPSFKSLNDDRLEALKQQLKLAFEAKRTFGNNSAALIAAKMGGDTGLARKVIANRVATAETDKRIKQLEAQIQAAEAADKEALQNEVNELKQKQVKLKEEADYIQSGKLFEDYRVMQALNASKLKMTQMVGGNLEQRASEDDMKDYDRAKKVREVRDRMAVDVTTLPPLPDELITALEQAQTPEEVRVAYAAIQEASTTQMVNVSQEQEQRIRAVIDKNNKSIEDEFHRIGYSLSGDVYQNEISSINDRLNMQDRKEQLEESLQEVQKKLAADPNDAQAQDDLQRIQDEIQSIDEALQYKGEFDNTIRGLRARALEAERKVAEAQTPEEQEAAQKELDDLLDEIDDMGLPTSQRLDNGRLTNTTSELGKRINERQKKLNERKAKLLADNGDTTNIDQELAQLHAELQQVVQNNQQYYQRGTRQMEYEQQMRDKFINDPLVANFTSMLDLLKTFPHLGNNLTGGMDVKEAIQQLETYVKEQNTKSADKKYEVRYVIHTQDADGRPKQRVVDRKEWESSTERKTVNIDETSDDGKTWRTNLSFTYVSPEQVNANRQMTVMELGGRKAPMAEHVILLESRQKEDGSYDAADVEAAKKINEQAELAYAAIMADNTLRQLDENPEKMRKGLGSRMFDRLFGKLKKRPTDETTQEPLFKHIDPKYIDGLRDHIEGVAGRSRAIVESKKTTARRENVLRQYQEEMNKIRASVLTGLIKGINVPSNIVVSEDSDEATVLLAMENLAAFIRTADDATIDQIKVNIYEMRHSLNTDGNNSFGSINEMEELTAESFKNRDKRSIRNNVITTTVIQLLASPLGIRTQIRNLTPNIKDGKTEGGFDIGFAMTFEQEEALVHQQSFIHACMLADQDDAFRKKFNTLMFSCANNSGQNIYLPDGTDEATKSAIISSHYRHFFCPGNAGTGKTTVGFLMNLKMLADQKVTRPIVIVGGNDAQVEKLKSVAAKAGVRALVLKHDELTADKMNDPLFKDAIVLVDECSLIDGKQFINPDLNKGLINRTNHHGQIFLHFGDMGQCPPSMKTGFTFSFPNNMLSGINLVATMRSDVEQIGQLQYLFRYAMRPTASSYDPNIFTVSIPTMYSLEGNEQKGVQLFGSLKEALDAGIARLKASTEAVVIVDTEADRQAYIKEYGLDEEQSKRLFSMSDKQSSPQGGEFPEVYVCINRHNYTDDNMRQKKVWQKMMLTAVSRGQRYVGVYVQHTQPSRAVKNQEVPSYRMDAETSLEMRKNARASLDKRVGAGVAMPYDINKKGGIGKTGTGVTPPTPPTATPPSPTPPTPPTPKPEEKKPEEKKPETPKDETKPTEPFRPSVGRRDFSPEPKPEPVKPSLTNYGTQESVIPVPKTPLRVQSTFEKPQVNTPLAQVVTAVNPKSKKQRLEAVKSAKNLPVVNPQDVAEQIHDGDDIQPPVEEPKEQEKKPEVQAEEVPRETEAPKSQPEEVQTMTFSVNEPEAKSMVHNGMVVKEGDLFKMNGVVWRVIQLVPEENNVVLKPVSNYLFDTYKFPISALSSESAKRVVEEETTMTDASTVNKGYFFVGGGWTLDGDLLSDYEASRSKVYEGQTITASKAVSKVISPSGVMMEREVIIFRADGGAVIGVVPTTDYTGVAIGSDFATSNTVTVLERQPVYLERAGADRSLAELLAEVKAKDNLVNTNLTIQEREQDGRIYQYIMVGDQEVQVRSQPRVWSEVENTGVDINTITRINLNGWGWEMGREVSAYLGSLNKIQMSKMRNIINNRQFNQLAVDPKMYPILHLVSRGILDVDNVIDNETSRFYKLAVPDDPNRSTTAQQGQIKQVIMESGKPIVYSLSQRGQIISNPEEYQAVGVGRVFTGRVTVSKPVPTYFSDPLVDEEAAVYDIDTKQAESMVDTILGAASVKSLELVDNLTDAQGRAVNGMVRNGAIRMNIVNGLAASNKIFHEVTHVIVEFMVSPDTREAIYDEMQRRKGYEGDWRNDTTLRSRIAEDIAKEGERYLMDRRNVKGVSKIMRTIYDWVRAAARALGMYNSPLESVLWNAKRGRYRNSPIDRTTTDQEFLSRNNPLLSFYRIYDNNQSPTLGYGVISRNAMRLGSMVGSANLDRSHFRQGNIQPIDLFNRMRQSVVDDALLIMTQINSSTGQPLMRQTNGVWEYWNARNNRYQPVPSHTLAGINMPFSAANILERNRLIKDLIGMIDQVTLPNNTTLRDVIGNKQAIMSMPTVYRRLFDAAALLRNDAQGLIITMKKYMGNVDFDTVVKGGNPDFNVQAIADSVSKRENEQTSMGDRQSDMMKVMLATIPASRVTVSFVNGRPVMNIIPEAYAIQQALVESVLRMINQYWSPNFVRTGNDFQDMQRACVLMINSMAQEIVPPARQAGETDEAYHRRAEAEMSQQVPAHMSALLSVYMRFFNTDPQPALFRLDRGQRVPVSHSMAVQMMELAHGTPQQQAQAYQLYQTMTNEPVDRQLTMDEFLQQVDNVGVRSLNMLNSVASYIKSSVRNEYMRTDRRGHTVVTRSDDGTIKMNRIKREAMVYFLDRQGMLGKQAENAWIKTRTPKFVVTTEGNDVVVKTTIQGQEYVVMRNGDTSEFNAIRELGIKTHILRSAWEHSGLGVMTPWTASVLIRQQPVHVQAILGKMLPAAFVAAKTIESKTLERTLDDSDVRAVQAYLDSQTNNDYGKESMASIVDYEQNDDTPSEGNDDDELFYFPTGFYRELNAVADRMAYTQDGFSSPGWTYNVAGEKINRDVLGDSITSNYAPNYGQRNIRMVEQGIINNHNVDSTRRIINPVMQGVITKSYIGDGYDGGRQLRDFTPLDRVTFDMNMYLRSFSKRGTGEFIMPLFNQADRLSQRWLEVKLPIMTSNRGNAFSTIDDKDKPVRNDKSIAVLTMQRYALMLNAQVKSFERWANTLNYIASLPAESGASLTDVAPVIAAVYYDERMLMTWLSQGIADKELGKRIKLLEQYINANSTVFSPSKLSKLGIKNGVIAGKDYLSVSNSTGRTTKLALGWDARLDVGVMMNGDAGMELMSGPGQVFSGASFFQSFLGFTHSAPRRRKDAKKVYGADLLKGVNTNGMTLADLGTIVSRMPASEASDFVEAQYGLMLDENHKYLTSLGFKTPESLLGKGEAAGMGLEDSSGRRNAHLEGFIIGFTLINDFVQYDTVGTPATHVATAVKTVPFSQRDKAYLPLTADYSKRMVVLGSPVFRTANNQFSLPQELPYLQIEDVKQSKFLPSISGYGDNSDRDQSIDTTDGMTYGNPLYQILRHRDMGGLFGPANASGVSKQVGYHIDPRNGNAGVLKKSMDSSSNTLFNMSPTRMSYLQFMLNPYRLNEGSLWHIYQVLQQEDPDTAWERLADYYQNEMAQLRRSLNKDYLTVDDVPPHLTMVAQMVNGSSNKAKTTRVKFPTSFIIGDRMIGSPSRNGTPNVPVPLSTVVDGKLQPLMQDGKRAVVMVNDVHDLVNIQLPQGTVADMSGFFDVETTAREGWQMNANTTTDESQTPFRQLLNIIMAHPAGIADGQMVRLTNQLALVINRGVNEVIQAIERGEDGTVTEDHREDIIRNLKQLLRFNMSRTGDLGMLAQVLNDPNTTFDSATGARIRALQLLASWIRTKALKHEMEGQRLINQPGNDIPVYEFDGRVWTLDELRQHFDRLNINPALFPPPRQLKEYGLRLLPEHQQAWEARVEELRSQGVINPKTVATREFEQAGMCFMQQGEAIIPLPGQNKYQLPKDVSLNQLFTVYRGQGEGTRVVRLDTFVEDGMLTQDEQGAYANDQGVYRISQVVQDLWNQYITVQGNRHVLTDENYRLMRQDNAMLADMLYREYHNGKLPPVDDEPTSTHIKTMYYIQDKIVPQVVERVLYVSRAVRSTIGVRVPSGPGSGFYGQVVGVVNDNGSPMYVNALKNLIDGADHDVDQTTMYYSSITKHDINRNEERTSEDEVNTLLGMIREYFLDTNKSSYTTEKIQLDKLQELSDQNRDALFTNGQKLNDYSNHIIVGDMAVKGKVTVGPFANAQKVTTTLFRAGVRSGERWADNISNDHVNMNIRWAFRSSDTFFRIPIRMEMFVNAGTDNAKVLALGTMNTYFGNTNIVIGAQICWEELVDEMRSRQAVVNEDYNDINAVYDFMSGQASRNVNRRIERFKSMQNQGTVITPYQAAFELYNRTINGSKERKQYIENIRKKIDDLKLAMVNEQRNLGNADKSVTAQVMTIRDQQLADMILGVLATGRRDDNIDDVVASANEQWANDQKIIRSLMKNKSDLTPAEVVQRMRERVDGDSTLTPEQKQQAQSIIDEAASNIEQLQSVIDTMSGMHRSLYFLNKRLKQLEDEESETYQRDLLLIMKYSIVGDWIDAMRIVPGMDQGIPSDPFMIHLKEEQFKQLTGGVTMRQAVEWYDQYVEEKRRNPNMTPSEFLTRAGAPDGDARYEYLKNANKHTLAKPEYAWMNNEVGDEASDDPLRFNYLAAKAHLGNPLALFFGMPDGMELVRAAIQQQRVSNAIHWVTRINEDLKEADLPTFDDMIEEMKESLGLDRLTEKRYYTILQQMDSWMVSHFMGDRGNTLFQQAFAVITANNSNPMAVSGDVRTTYDMSSNTSRKRFVADFGPFFERSKEQLRQTYQERVLDDPAAEDVLFFLDELSVQNGVLAVTNSSIHQQEDEERMNRGFANLPAEWRIMLGMYQVAKNGFEYRRGSLANIIGTSLYAHYDQWVRNNVVDVVGDNEETIRRRMNTLKEEMLSNVSNNLGQKAHKEKKPGSKKWVAVPPIAANGHAEYYREDLITWYARGYRNNLTVMTHHPVSDVVVQRLSGGFDVSPTSTTIGDLHPQRAQLPSMTTTVEYRMGRDTIKRTVTIPAGVSVEAALHIMMKNPHVLFQRQGNGQIPAFIVTPNSITINPEYVQLVPDWIDRINRMARNYTHRVSRNNRTLINMDEQTRVFNVLYDEALKSNPSLKQAYDELVEAVTNAPSGQRVVSDHTNPGDASLAAKIVNDVKRQDRKFDTSTTGDYINHMLQRMPRHFRHRMGSGSLMYASNQMEGLGTSDNSVIDLNYRQALLFAYIFDKVTSYDGKHTSLDFKDDADTMSDMRYRYGLIVQRVATSRNRNEALDHVRPYRDKFRQMGIDASDDALLQFFSNGRQWIFNGEDANRTMQHATALYELRNNNELTNLTINNIASKVLEQYEIGDSIFFSDGFKGVVSNIQRTMSGKVIGVSYTVTDGPNIINGTLQSKIRNANTKEGIIKFAQGLMRSVSGANLQFVTQEQAAMMGQGTAMSFYQDGTVYINTDQADRGVVMHEVAHPIIMAMKHEHPELYRAFVDQLKNTRLYDWVSDNHQGESDDVVEQETLAYYLQLRFDQQLAAQEGMTMQPLWDGFNEWMSDSTNKLFGGVYDQSKSMSNIDWRNATAADVADAILNDMLNGRVLTSATNEQLRAWMPHTLRASLQSNMKGLNTTNMRAVFQRTIEADRDQALRDEILNRVSKAINSGTPYHTSLGETVDLALGATYWNPTTKKREVRFKDEDARRKFIMEKLMPAEVEMVKKTGDNVKRMLVNAKDSSPLAAVSQTIKPFWADTKDDTQKAIREASAVTMLEQIGYNPKTDKVMTADEAGVPKELMGENPIIIYHNHGLPNQRVSILTMTSRSMYGHGYGNKELMGSTYLNKDEKRQVWMTNEDKNIWSVQNALIGMYLQSQDPTLVVDRVGVVGVYGSSNTFKPYYIDMSEIAPQVKAIFNNKDIQKQLSPELHALATNEGLIRRNTAKVPTMEKVKGYINTILSVLPDADRNQRSLFEQAQEYMKRQDAGEDMSLLLADVVRRRIDYLKYYRYQGRPDDLKMSPEYRELLTFYMALRQRAPYIDYRVSSIDWDDKWLQTADRWNDNVRNWVFNEIDLGLRRHKEELGTFVRTHKQKVEQLQKRYGSLSYALDQSHELFKPCFIKKQGIDLNGNKVDIQTLEIHWNKDDERTRKALAMGEVSMMQVEYGKWLMDQLEEEFIKYVMSNNQYRPDASDNEKYDSAKAEVQSRWRKGMLPALRERYTAAFAKGNYGEAFDTFSKQQAVEEFASEDRFTAEDHRTILSQCWQQFSSAESYGGDGRLKAMGLAMREDGVLVVVAPDKQQSLSLNLEHVGNACFAASSRTRNLKQAAKSVNAAIELLETEERIRGVDVSRHLEQLNIYINRNLYGELPTHGKTQILGMTVDIDKALNTGGNYIAMAMLGANPKLVAKNMMSSGMKMFANGMINSLTRTQVFGAGDVMSAVTEMMSNPQLVEAINAKYQVVSYSERDLLNHMKYNRTRQVAVDTESSMIGHWVGDYYVQLIAMVAQMKKDGSWDAHKLNAQGELVYDHTKDSRFKGDDGTVIMQDLVQDLVREGWQTDTKQPTLAYSQRDQARMKAVLQRYAGEMTDAQLKNMASAYGLGRAMMTFKNYLYNVRQAWWRERGEEKMMAERKVIDGKVEWVSPVTEGIIQTLWYAAKSLATMNFKDGFDKERQRNIASWLTFASLSMGTAYLVALALGDDDEKEQMNAFYRTSLELINAAAKEHMTIVNPADAAVQVLDQTENMYVIQAKNLGHMIGATVVAPYYVGTGQATWEDFTGYIYDLSKLAPLGGLYRNVQAAVNEALNAE